MYLFIMPALVIGMEKIVTIFLVKTASTGTEEWSKFIGGEKIDKGYYIQSSDTTLSPGPTQFELENKSVFKISDEK